MFRDANPKVSSYESHPASGQLATHSRPHPASGVLLLLLLEAN
jgi:hypothetical protein